MSYMPKDIMPQPMDNERSNNDILRAGADALSEFNLQATHIRYAKLTIEDILQRLKTINVDKIVDEILAWAIANVENYVDNHRKLYKLDLVLDAAETMPESKKLQDLYRAIPEDEDAVSEEQLITKDTFLRSLDKVSQSKLDSFAACRAELDAVTKQVEEKLKAHQQHRDALFSRLIYYYEMKGMKDGNLLVQDLQGTVDILRFEYESFPVAVRIKSPKVIQQDEHGKTYEVAGETTKEYVIPEGFTLWLELAFRPKVKPTAMF